jgi:WS/DGAT C-terminal domain
VMSYLDHLDFGIVADRDQVDDVWELLDLHATALGELEEAVLGRREGVRQAHVMPSLELSGAPA